MWLHVIEHEGIRSIYMSVSIVYNSWACTSSIERAAFIVGNTRLHGVCAVASVGTMHAVG